MRLYSYEIKFNRGKSDDGDWAYALSKPVFYSAKLTPYAESFKGFIDAVGATIYVSFYKDDEYISFYLSAFHGNCGIAIISHVTTQGLDFACEFAKEMGYTMLLYSVAEDDGDDDGCGELLTKHGFKPCEQTTCTNKRSQNEITVWVKHVTRDKKEEEEEEEDWDVEEVDY